MKTLVVALCLGMILSARAAHATLITINDTVYGPGSLVLDTSTGLEWARLTLSTGLSVNSILGGTDGFVANGFTVGSLSQVERLLTDGGWDGVDDSSTNGSLAHAVFVQEMMTFLGTTGHNSNGGPFFEGWATSTVPGEVGRPFGSIGDFVPADGRVACTTAGFMTFPNLDFSGCRQTYDANFAFIGAYLDRAAPVPEPATLTLTALGLAGVMSRYRRRHASR